MELLETAAQELDAARGSVPAARTRASAFGAGPGAGTTPSMGTVLDLMASRSREAPPASAYGLVTELVDSEQPDGRQPTRGRKGVVHMGGLATVCVVEDVPAVGDLIRGDVAGVVEKVRVTREGRVLIYARPAASP